MSIFDPLQWIATAFVIFFVMLIVGGVLLRLYRALVGEMPVEGQTRTRRRRLGEPVPGARSSASPSER
ncbi:MAG: hypothetical protein ABSF83_12320 [Nitrososphaerales archaeon]|jgi:hypothetical protein